MRTSGPRYSLGVETTGMSGLSRPSDAAPNVPSRDAADAKQRLWGELREYLEPLMHEPGPGEPWGLFRYCEDDRMPYSIVAPGCASVPRNVALIAHACIVASDHRRGELRQVLVEVTNELRAYQQPDGGFAYEQDGRTAKGWCGARIAGPSAKPCSDVHGSINVMDTLFSIYSWLEMTNDDMDRENWRTVWQDLRYRVFVDREGRVQIEPGPKH